MSTATSGRAREHKPAADRFRAKFREGEPEECWPWLGHVRRNGYGSFMGEGQRTVLAHRFAYELARGRIPAGLTIDHLCGVRSCVNPAHMETVTRAENTRRARSWEGASRARSAAASASCPAGHSWTPDNTYIRPKDGFRECRICRRERDAARWSK